MITCPSHTSEYFCRGGKSGEEWDRVLIKAGSLHGKVLVTCLGLG